MLLLPVIAGLILACLLMLTVVPILINSKRYREKSSPAHIVFTQVLVLGDIGRSPRMQYHALSIVRHGGFVSLIGYQGENMAFSCGGAPILFCSQ